MAVAAPDFIPDAQAAPDFIPDAPAHASAPDFIPDPTPDTPKLSGSFQQKYAQQQQLNKVGTGGGSPVTPREVEESRAVAGASDFAPINAGIQTVKMALASKIGNYDPEALRLIQHENAVANPVKPSLVNKAGGIVGGVVKGAAEFAAGGPALMAAEAGFEGSGESRADTAQRRDAGEQISGASETGRAIGSGVVDAANAYGQGKLLGGTRGMRGAGPNAIVAGGMQGVTRAAKNVISGQPILEGVKDEVRDTALTQFGVHGAMEGAKVIGERTGLTQTPPERPGIIQRQSPPDFIPDEPAVAVSPANAPVAPDFIPDTAPVNEHAKALRDIADRMEGKTQAAAAQPDQMVAEQTQATSAAVPHTAPIQGESAPRPVQTQESVAPPEVEPVQQAASSPDLTTPAAPPVKGEGASPGFVRMYHGGTDYNGGERWLTPDLKYAQGYADKNANTGAKVHYVDLPEDHPLLTKSFDDTGSDVKAPYNSFNAPEEIAKQLKPAPPVKGEGPKPVYRDTRASGERFHGTSNPIEQLQDYNYNDQNIYGQGLYTTDDFTTANAYTKKGGGKEPSVYKVNEKRPMKMLDLEQPPTPDVHKVLDSLGDNSWDSLGQFAHEIYKENPNAPLRKWFDEVRAASRSEGLSTDSVQELFQSVTDQLRDVGYDGYRHEGGNLAGRGKRTHDVKVYFDPTSSVDIAKVNAQDYSVPVPAEPFAKSVVRYEEPGVDKVDFEKPHGVYTTPSDVESPHADLGGKKFSFDLNPKGNTLDVPDYGKEVAMRKEAVGSGAGVSVVRHLLGADEFSRLKSLSKSGLSDWASKRFPGKDFSKYFDKQEVMEGIGGQLARDAGYDSFRQQSKDDPAFSEHVLLSKNAIVENNPLSQSQPELGQSEGTPATEVAPKLVGGAEQSFSAASANDPLFKYGSGDKPTSIKNATVDKERAARGLEPMMATIRQSDPSVWDAAMTKLDKNPSAAKDLVQEINQNPKPMSNVDDAMLLHYRVDLSNQREGNAVAMEQAQREGDVIGVAEHRVEEARIARELDDLEKASKLGGKETASGLRFRRALALEDFTLASMEQKSRAANGGKDLTPEQSAKVKNLNVRIKTAQKTLDQYTTASEAAREKGLVTRITNIEKQIASGQVDPKTGIQRAESKRITELKAKRDELNDQLSEIRGKPVRSQETIEAARQKAVSDQIDELTKRIAAGDISTKNAKQTVESREMTEMKSKRDALSKQLEKMRGDQTALKAFKTRTEGAIDKVKGRVEAGDFSPNEPRRQLKLDPQAEQLKAQLERYKQMFQDGLVKDRLKNRTPLEKTQDAFVKWRRAFLLSNPITIAKLTSAAAERIAITPAEEGVGGLLSKVFPKLAAKATRQGGFSVSAEAQALTEGFTKGMRDGYQTLKTGKSDLDTLYGHKSPLPRDATDFIGSLHGALKAPAKRAEFARSFAKQADAAIRGGLDPSDPIVQTRIALDAYKDAERAIFMQDNRVVSAWKRGIRALEEPSKTTGKVPLYGKAMATAGKVLLPIVKVPTNIVAETLETATGLVTGSARLGRAYAKGIENVKPEEANLIMRQLKKGSLGAAVMALGYFGADKIGGYYQPGQKRDEKDVKFGAVRVFGHDVPSYLIHNPLLEMLQIGATVRRVADSYRIKADKKRGETQGIGEGSLVAALGLAEEIPFSREAIELGKVFDPRTRDAAVGENIRSMVVPQAVQFAAQQMDKDAQGEPIVRHPKGILQNIEMGIPGLRERVVNIPADADAWKTVHAEDAVDLYEGASAEQRKAISAKIRDKIGNSKMTFSEKQAAYDRMSAADKKSR